MRPRLVPFLVCCALAVLALPASAQTEIVPQFRTSGVWFHCLGDSRLANPASLQGAVPGWNAMPPSASVTEGAGCASQDPPQTQTGQVNPLDGVWRGTIAGNVKSLRVSVHAFPRIVPDGPISLGVRLVVDGESMFGGTAAAPATKTITVAPLPANSDITNLVEFTITNLPFASEDGFGTASRTYTVSLLNTTTDVQWVYDTTEVGSGLLINGPSAGPVITAGT